MELINQLLVNEFHRQGFAAVGWGDTVVLDANGPRFSAWLVRETEAKGLHGVQVDYRLDLEDGRQIIVSLTGRGRSRAVAVDKTLELFGRGAMHVLAEGFFDERSEVLNDADWQLGDDTWYVLYSQWIVTGEGDNQWPEPPATYLSDVMRLVQDRGLEGDLHWLATYFGNFRDGRQISEVLLDNEPWPEAASWLDYWPGWSSDYTFRRFFLLRRA